MSKPSGKTNLRMSPELHAHLIEQAKAQGVSLNRYMVERLAGASGFKLSEDHTPTPARKTGLKQRK